MLCLMVRYYPEAVVPRNLDDVNANVASYIRFGQGIYSWTKPTQNSKDLQGNINLAINDIVFQFYKRSVRKEYEQHWDEEVDRKY